MQDLASGPKDRADRDDAFLRQLRGDLARLLPLLDFSGAALYLLGGEVRFAWTDQRHDARYGLPAKGEPWEGFVSQQELARRLASVRRVCRTGEPEVSSCDFELPNGDFHFDVLYSPVNSETGATIAVLALYRDTTESDLTTKALRASKDRYQEFADLASDYTYSYSVGPAGELTSEWQRDDLITALGYTGAEIGKLGWKGLVLPEDHPIAEQRVDVILSGLTDVREIRLVAKDGSVHWMLDSTKGVIDSKGKLLRVMGASRDITDRKQAELKAAQERGYVELLQAVATAANESTSVEQALEHCIEIVCRHGAWPVGHAYRPTQDGPMPLEPTGIWHVEDPERFASFRELTERTSLAPGVGLPGRMFVSREPVWITDVTEDANFARGGLAPDQGVGAAFGFPVFARGEVVALLEFFSADPLPANARMLEVAAMVGAQLRPVFERDHSQRELREIADRHRTISEIVSDYSFHADLRLDGSRTIRWEQGSLSRLIGQEISEFVAGDWRSMLEPSEVPRMLSLFRRVYAEGSAEGEFRIRTLHRGSRWQRVYLRGGPKSADGSAELFGVWKDIDDEKRAQEEVARYRARLETTERLSSLGTLAAGIAHEINNPLASMLAVTQNALLGSRTGGMLDRWEKALREIEGQIVRCGRITRSVLQFSRSENAERWDEDIDSVVRRACQRVGDLARSRSAKLEMQLDAGSERARINGLEMEQVLVNLLRNAIQSKPEGVRVVVRTSRSNESLRVQISDDGCGISESDVGRIFEPFFTSRATEGGTGLGLSASYGIVVAHGGSLEVESTPGKGSTLTVSIPSSGGSSEPAAGPTSPDS